MKKVSAFLIIVYLVFSISAIAEAYNSSVDTYLTEAETYLHNNEVDKAYIAISNALNLEPYSQEALLLRDRLQSMTSGSKNNAATVLRARSLASNNEIVDSEKPIIYLDTVVSDKSNVTVGDEVIVSLVITDNVGVNTANLSFTNLDSNKMIHYKNLTFNDLTNRWEYSFLITEDTPNGTWVVSDVYARDDVGNYIVEFTNIEVFTVHGGADSEKPNIDESSIIASSDNCTVGDRVTISAKITDNIGVTNANIALLNLESNKSYDFLYLQYNDDNDRWEYTFEITEETPNGTWAVSWFHAYDAIGNANIQFLKKAIFTVYGAADSQKPSIEVSSISASRDNATLCDTIIISLIITDDTRVKSANISIHNPDANNTLHYQPLSYNQTTDRWEYTFKVTDTIPDGTWYAFDIQAYDTVDNTIIVYPNIALFTTNHLFDFTNHQSLTLPKSLTVIEDSAFEACNIGNVIIPDGCKEIKTKAFSRAKGILRIYIPSTVTTIAEDAFDGCEDVVIYSKENCYAKQYANEHNIYFVLNK